MAIFITVLSLAVLILAATKGSCGEGQGSLYFRDDAVVAGMREVGQALQCFGETTQDCLLLQKQNNNMLLQIKEELQTHSENENSLKREIEALNKVITITQENTDLKIQLVNKDHKVDILTQENLDLKKQLAGKNQKDINSLNEEVQELRKLLETKNKTVVGLNQEIANKNEKVKQLTQQITEAKDQLTKNNQTEQDLGSKLEECQDRVQELEKQVKEPNNTLEPQKPEGWMPECKQQQQLEKIKEVVHAFINNKDWNTLTTGLGAVLNHSSDEYRQLHPGSLYWIGYYGYTKLASLLLCAGLPVDMASSDGSNMLQGAACGSALQLVKLLLQHGASVHRRGWYGRTPLVWAGYAGSVQVIQCLVEAGAETTVRDIEGRTALDWARSRQHTAMIQYLELLPH